MKDTEYVYAVAYMKTLENKMLTKNDIEALINAPDFSAALKILAEKNFGSNSGSGSDIEKILESELDKVWNEAVNVCPAEAPLDILKYKNDFHNLKTILKAFLTNVEWQNLMLKPSVTEPEELYEAVKAADFSDLPEFIANAAKGAYKIITSEHDGQAMEIYVDKMAYEAMKKRAAANEFLAKWVDMNIVFADFSIALRAFGKSREFIKNAMIETQTINIEKLVSAAEEGRKAVADFLLHEGYQEGADALENSYGNFEKWCDNKKMEFLKTAKNKFFGFEPIMAFLLGKESEIQAVRIILSGRKNGIPSEIIRERLRDLYV